MSTLYREYNEEDIEIFNEIFELIMLQCKYHYDIIKEENNNSITKEYVLSSLEKDYDEFLKEDYVINYISDFYELRNIEWEDFKILFDNVYKNKTLEYLKKHIDQIADYTNEMI